MRSLDEIACSFGTDKSTRTSLPTGDRVAARPPQGHGYTIFYEHYFSRFRQLPIRLLEIGVLDGRSLATWKEYFPNAAIYGLDIDPACARFEDSRAKIFIGSQSDPAVFDHIKQAVPEGFDIIIDDGSHYVKHVIASFGGLFGLLRAGGIYVVEDLHCAAVRHYGEIAYNKGLEMERLSQGNDPAEMVRFLTDTLNRPDVQELTIHLKKICFIEKSDATGKKNERVQRGDRIDDLYPESRPRPPMFRGFWKRLDRHFRRRFRLAS